MSEPTRITSRDNLLYKQLKLLSKDSVAHRKLGRVWLEGDHLCRALLSKRYQPQTSVFSESYWHDAPDELRTACDQRVLVPDALMAGLSALESPAGVGFVWNLPSAAPAIRPDAATVVLDRLQDAGNVGSILRSAAAMGFEQVLSLKGGAALWSPKVLRSGMGAHFALHLVEGLSLDDVQALRVPRLVTSSHRGQFLGEMVLPWPCAWVLGNEGQGVSEPLQSAANLHVRIRQPGGEESLNVAAAAAICLHASALAR